MWNGLRRCGVGTGGSPLWVELVRRIVLLGSKEPLGNLGRCTLYTGTRTCPIFCYVREIRWMCNDFGGLRPCGVGTGGLPIWDKWVKRTAFLGFKSFWVTCGVVLCTHGRVLAPFLAMRERLEGC